MTDRLKAGIITYHRSYNYGSALQAYALNRFLRENGIEAKTIDYKTKRQQDLYRIFEPSNSAMAIARNFQSLLYLGRLKKHIKLFDSFLQEEIPITETFTCPKKLRILNEEFDYFICGSDQIWNPNCIDFDDSYLLSFVKNKSKCISYAPSIAISYIPNKWEKTFKEDLSGFRALSVREKKGTEVIRKLTRREVVTVLDPVFLISAEAWRELAICHIKKPYILCYFIGDVTGMRDYAKRMKKILKLPLVVVYKNLRDMLYINQKEYDTGPKEFLGLIKNADYICTNSFHAVAYSLLFRKNFWAFCDIDKPLSAGSRIEHILEITGFQNRLLNYRNMHEAEDPTLPVCYNENFNKRLSNKIQYSASFILEALKEVKQDGSVV
jgi:hypothetical protein